MSFEEAQRNYDNQEAPGFYDNDDVLASDCCEFRGTDLAFFKTKETDIENYFLIEGYEQSDFEERCASFYVFQLAMDELEINSDSYIAEGYADDLYKLAVEKMIQITKGKI